MDRISALRNVEAALSEFEAGEIPLGRLEERVAGVLRTYATEFEAAAGGGSRWFFSLSSWLRIPVLGKR